jgi:hypothetical protein
VSIDPASEDQHQKLQRQSVHQSGFRQAKPEETGRNRRFDARLSTRNRACFGSADFWHTTRARDETSADPGGSGCEAGLRFRVGYRSAESWHTTRKKFLDGPTFEGQNSQDHAWPPDRARITVDLVVPGPIPLK